MADRTQLKIADRDQLSNDDPFAELTRIMGFDPRQPVQQGPAAAPSSVASVQETSSDNAGDDDFGIDLEKELMGEFTHEDAGHGNVHAFQPAYRTEEPAYQAEAPAAYEPEVSADEPELVQFEALDLPSAEDEPAVAVEAGYEPAVAFEPVPVESPSAEAEGFDDAVVAAMQNELSLDGDWAHAEAAVEEASPEYEAETVAEYQAMEDPQPVVDYDAAGEYAPAEYVPAEVAPEEPEAGAFDEAIAASIEGDQAPEGEWSSADQAGSFAAYEDAAEPGYEIAGAELEPAAYEAAPAHYDAAPAYEAAADDYDAQPVAAVASEEDFADDFDAALAEVDMDFTAVPLKSSGHGSVDPELDRELEIHLQPDVPVSVAEENGLSFEDELNALLGNVHAHHDEAAPVVEAAADEPLPAVAEQVADEDIELELADEDLLAEASSVDAAQSVPTYSRGNYRAGQSAFAAPAVDDQAPVAGEHAPVLEGHEAEAAVEADDFEPAAEAEADIDLEFDDEAFDAAFASSIDDTDLTLDDEEYAPAEQPAATASGRTDDPYADLAALTAQFTPTGPISSWNRPVVAEYDHAGAEDQPSPAAAFDNGIPDIETVDVPEQAVALAEDLDIPEVAYEEDVPAAPAYDDIDAEFASLLNDMNSPEPATVAQTQPAAAEADDFAADFEREFQIDEDALAQSHPYQTAAVAGAAAAGALGATAAHAAYAPAASAGQQGFDPAAFSASQGRGQYQQPNVDDFDYDPDADEEMASTAYGAGEKERPQRRGMLIAAIVGGVAIVGAIGAYALSGGNVGSGAPALVKADADPIKVRPENPGGTVVPNQDNKVYDTVSRTASTNEPKQEKLVTTAEEPIDMAAQDDPEPAIDDTDMVSDTEANASAPVAKSEDRIEQMLQEDDAGQNGEVAAVTPRKVRTMVVRSDGTLVPREEPAPAAAAPAIDPATTASESVTNPVGATNTAANASAPAVKPAAQLNANEPVPAEANAAPAAPKAAAKPQNTTTPNSVAVAPTRPSDQPVDVVGEVKADKVAALAPANAGAAGAWSMQIASQPSEAAAQSSYQDLQRRYGSVLNGQQANIVKAEIAGKGTFWRVRVPAPSRNEAIALCERYKAAGGNCFVSK